MKKIIATIMAVAFMLGHCSITAMAAEDIVLNGDSAGASSLIGEFAGSGGEYSYIGFATFNGVTEDYKYLELTYTGDISTLRLELTREDGSMAGPYWFVSSQVMKFVTADGSKIDTNPSAETTVVLDLEASGINIGEFNGTHLHYLSPDVQSATFTITDARFTSGTDAVAETAEAEEDVTAAKTGSTAIPTAVACLVALCAGTVLVANKKKNA